MSVIEKVKELWNSNCDDYYITDINNNVISSFYFGEAFKSENADKILKQSEETILKLLKKNAQILQKNFLFFKGINLMKSVEIVLKKKQIIKYVLDKYKFQNYDTSNIGYDELSDNWDNFGKKYILGKNICKNK